jgi:hypothetical protein
VPVAFEDPTVIAVKHWNRFLDRVDLLGMISVSLAQEGGGRPVVHPQAPPPAPYERHRRK